MMKSVTSMSLALLLYVVVADFAAAQIDYGHKGPLNPAADGCATEENVFSFVSTPLKPSAGLRPSPMGAYSMS